MMGKRFLWTAALATLLASAGCRTWCEHHGYCPSQPCAPQCCPCGPAVGYAAPQPAGWNAPVAAPPPAAGTCPAGCVAAR